MAKDGGFCNCCEKHHIRSSQDAIDALKYGLQLKEQKPLLTIELKDETSVPTVFYKGEEIKLKQNIFFDWETKGVDNQGGLTYVIEHAVIDEGHAVINRLERRVNGHAT